MKNAQLCVDTSDRFTSLLAMTMCEREARRASHENTLPSESRSLARSLLTKRVLFAVAGIKMGCFGSKDKLSKEDMDFLKSHTRYDEATIKEWYKGFKVSIDVHALIAYYATCEREYVYIRIYTGNNNDSVTR